MTYTHEALRAAIDKARADLNGRWMIRPWLCRNCGTVFDEDSEDTEEHSPKCFVADLFAHLDTLTALLDLARECDLEAEVTSTLRADQFHGFRDALQATVADALRKMGAL